MAPDHAADGDDPESTASREPALSRRRQLVHSLGLEPSVVAASSAVFTLGFGEELWKKFLPKYMESLGAGPGVIGLFGTAEDFLDAVYQYPGGWLADRLGRRRAFLLFVLLASAGYGIYLAAPSWPWLFVGLAFVMAWSSMASPAIFAVIGDALPRERRARGFMLQSMLKRVPMLVSPPLGGAWIARRGIASGVRGGLVVTLGLAALTVAVVRAVEVRAVAGGEGIDLCGVWRSFHVALRRLLVSDIVIRTCEGMAEVFVVLYVTNVTRIGMARFGVLVAIQMLTSILAYVPAARLADRTGRKPFVIATFACFALFPVAVVLASGFAALVAAFVIGGLREIGEPSRKAMIVDLAEPHLRARTVGLYYLVRSLATTPAAALGGLLWKLAPQVPFYVAGGIGLAGTVLFALTVEERHAGSLCV